MKTYDAKGLRVGLVYNLRVDFEKNVGDPIDINADWDVFDTIKRLSDSLDSIGCKVVNIGNPQFLINPGIRDSIDVVFSICEMNGGSFRESLVPSLCEIIDIPYLLSGPSTLTNSLDKNIANLLALQYGIPVKPWFFIKDIDSIDEVKKLNNYPYIIKPAYGGSSMGIAERSIVRSYSSAKENVLAILLDYSQPVIIQEYISGREFTVGVYEKNGSLCGLEPIEISPIDSKEDEFIYSYNAKENSSTSIVYRDITNDRDLRGELINIALKAHTCFDCQDVSRVDLRLDSNGSPYFIEINPLPHMHPDISDFFRSSTASGITHSHMLLNIIDNFCLRMASV